MKPEIDQDTVMRMAMFTSNADIKSLFAGRESVSAQEIASWGVSSRDRVIILICTLPPQHQRLFSVECAESIQHIFNDPQADLIIDETRRSVFSQQLSENICRVAEGIIYNTFSKPNLWRNTETACSTHDVVQILRWITDPDPQYAAIYSTMILDLVDDADMNREKQLSQLVKWHMHPEELLEKHLQKTKKLEG